MSNGWSYDTRQRFTRKLKKLGWTVKNLDTATRTGGRETVEIKLQYRRSVAVTAFPDPDHNEVGRLDYVEGGQGHGWPEDLATRAHEQAAKTRSDLITDMLARGENIHPSLETPCATT